MTRGRWPANVVLSPEMARILDEQSGILTSGTRKNAGTKRDDETGWRFKGGAREGDSGGASRFFLEAWYDPDELEWIYANGLRPYGA